MWEMFLCRVNSGTSQALQGTPMYYWTCLLSLPLAGGKHHARSSQGLWMTLDRSPTQKDTPQTYLNFLKMTSSVHVDKTVRTGWETWGCCPWRRLLGDLFQCLKGAYKKSGDRRFSWAFCQGRAGQGCEQSDPVEYLPGYCREGGLLWFFPIQIILWFYKDSAFSAYLWTTSPFLIQSLGLN